jgi:hypothetical protein
MICMRLSLQRAAHAVVASSAKQEIRVRFGRDDKEGGVAKGGLLAGWGETTGPASSFRNLSFVFARANRGTRGSFPILVEGGWPLRVSSMLEHMLYLELGDARG